MNGQALLDVRHLVVTAGRGRAAIRAVDDVSLCVGPAETVGLVGESGSGKSTIARAIAGLAVPASGTIIFDGQDITRVSRRRRRRLSSGLQMVFQDPSSSLNPARTVAQTLTEPLLARRGSAAASRLSLVMAAMSRVGLPEDMAARYPGQLSGGQRQRVAIARALVGSPSLVICDEPVSALDLSVQAQIINLFSSLQADLGLSYLFIAHDLAVVRHLSHRIVVLYHGQVVESGVASTVWSDPAHPYTRALIAAAPVADPERARAAAALRERTLVAGATRPQPLSATGCRFAARCPYALDACTRQRPALVEAGNRSHVACLRHSEIAEFVVDQPPPVGAVAFHRPVRT